MEQDKKNGILYLCATPIGNLEDITLRVLRILKEVDLIAAEDTRHTLKLLNHFNIKNSLTSYYEHNKTEKSKYLVSKLKEGKKIALVSDAGTPAISDPGCDLVKLCIKEKIKVIPLPGATAIITALIASGQSTDRFMFEGFLTTNRRKRKEHLNSIKNDTHTIVFYEAPHKLKNTLKDLYEIFGNRNVVLCRELTKKYEEEIPKGEFVVIVEGEKLEKIIKKEREIWNEISITEHIDMYINQGMSKKEALKKVSKDRGVSKREIYSDTIKKQRD